MGKDQGQKVRRIMIKSLKATAAFLCAAAVVYFQAVYTIPKDIYYYLANFTAFFTGIIVYHALGVKLLKLMGIKPGNPEKYVYSFALASVFMGTLMFALGVLKLFNFYSVFASTVITALVCIKEIKQEFNEIASGVKNFAKAGITAPDSIKASFVIFIFIYFFITSLTPPVYYDTLVYHLGIVQQYINAGGITGMPENVFAGFPQLMQMNYAYFLLLSYELSVKLFVFYTALMLLLLVARFAADLGGGIYVTAGLLLSSPLFFLNSTRVGAELPVAFYTMLLLYILFRFLKKGAGIKESVFAGIMAGAVMSVKYTGVIPAVFAGFIYFYLISRKQAGIKGLIVFAGTALTVLLPYLAKNFIFTGSPVYPFLSPLFGAKGSLVTDAANYTGHIAGFGVHKNALSFLVAPFTAVYKRQLFGGDIISPLILVVIFLAPFYRDRKMALLFVFAGFYFTVWFFTASVLRFLLPLVIVLILIAGRIEALMKSKFKVLLFAWIIAVQALVCFYFAERYLKPFEIFTGSRDEYIGKNVSYYRAAGFINEKASKNDVIFFMGEARTFYCREKVLAYTVFNSRELLDGFKEKSNKEIAAGFINKGINYILLNRAELERLKTGGFNDVYDTAVSLKFKNLIDKHFETIYSDNTCDIFKVKGRSL